MSPNKRDISELTPAARGYLAGFFDADGGLQVWEEDGYPRIRVAVTQATPEVLYRFQAAFGGSVFRDKDYMYRWHRGGYEFVKQFNDELGPHLLVKKERVNAELAQFARKSARVRK